MAKWTIFKGVWLKLPSGALVQVCEIKKEKNPEATLRYLDQDGVMATGNFFMRLTWLYKYAEPVKISYSPYSDGRDDQ